MNLAELEVNVPPFAEISSTEASLFLGSAPSENRTIVKVNNTNYEIEIK